ncbi:hypothetical protein M422DRAFT_272199, partial [Sphaerobolus stellatus SS14]
MSYYQPICNEQLAPFLEAAKLMTIPANEVPPLVVKEIPAPSASQNTTILAMNQAMIAQAIKTNTENAKEYEEQKELWYHETAIAVFLDAKRKAEEAAAKRKAEEAAVKKKAEEDAKAAAEKENKRAMDANSEGEDEVNQDETPKSKSKKTKSRSIVDSESEEETEEVKAKRRKAKGKGKAIDPEYTRNTQPVDYTGCPRVPVHKICEGCKVPPDLLCKIKGVLLRLSYAKQQATDDEELQAKLKRLCDEQDAFKEQKDKEKAERSKNVGNRTKAGTKKTVQVNAKASGSTPKGSKRKVVSEEDDIVVETRPKRARTVANSTGSNERILSVAESLHGINQALIQTVTLLGDNRAVNEHTA